MATDIPSNTKHAILIVDDDRLILSTLSASLTSEGYQVSTAESVDEAEVWLSQNERPDLVLLDMRMPGRLGLDLSDRLNAMNHIPFILLTAYSEQEIVTQTKLAGAMGYLVKPVEISQLIPAIETAISRAEEFQQLRQTKEGLQTALDGDRAISVAVGILMDQHCVNHDYAYEMIRRDARNQHLKLMELATRIIDARETLNFSKA